MIEMRDVLRSAGFPLWAQGGQEHLLHGMPGRVRAANELVAQLSCEECDGFLSRFAKGDSTATMELKKRLYALMPPPPATPEVHWPMASC
jgi:hypothetical protein